MIKSNKLLILLLLPLSVFAATKHDNLFCSVGPASTGGPNANQSLQFIPDSNTSFSITPGQPYSKSISSSSNCFTIDAGRKGDMTNTTWAAENALVSNAIVPSYAAFLSPSAENFALKGTLVISNKVNNQNTTYYCKEVVIAQDYQQDKNFWWIYTNTGNTSSLACNYPDSNSSQVQYINVYSAPSNVPDTTGFQFIIPQ